MTDRVFMEYVILGKVTAKEYKTWKASLTVTQQNTFVQYAKDNIKLIKEETWERYLSEDRFNIDDEWRKKTMEEELKALNDQLAYTTVVIPNASYGNSKRYGYVSP